MQQLINQCKCISVLYIEEDLEIRENTHAVLKEFFDDIHVAENGQIGFDYFKEHQHTLQLVITDIKMPSLNGIDIVYAIRELSHDVSIIVISAHTQLECFLKSIEAGVDGYLLKPMQKEQLITALSKAKEKITLRLAFQENISLLQQYEMVTNESSIISKTDPHGIITYVNDKFCQISGFSKEELIGSAHSIIRHPDMPKSAFTDLWKTIKKDKKTWKGVVKNRAKNGEPYYVKSTIQPILSVTGDIIEYIALRHDITAIMSDKKQLFDYLEANKLSVLILVQIEDYTILEKFYDKVSVEKIEQNFGKTLLYLMPNPWGFQKVYHLENGLYAFAIDRRTCTADKDEITQVLEQFLQNVKEYTVTVGAIEYDISAICSFTYGVFHIFEDAKIGIENAIKNRQSIVYADGLSSLEYEVALNNIETIHTIKTAIDNHKIVSYFQPIVNNHTLEIEKYESLVRLIDETNTVISPFYFLEIAKKGRYYSKITKIVLDNSFEALRKTDKIISINLSAFDIEEDEIKEYIFKLLDTHVDDAHRVLLELVESEMIKKFKTISDFIIRVKKKGVQIAIDDFGTGYSNFERLLEYQPDIIKIDGSLIKNILTSPFNRNIIETIVVFAQKQHIKTVAEFVENEAIFLAVKEMGIDFSQGYAFGKPEPLSFYM